MNEVRTKGLARIVVILISLPMLSLGSGTAWAGGGPLPSEPSPTMAPSEPPTTAPDPTTAPTVDSNQRGEADSSKAPGAPVSAETPLTDSVATNASSSVVPWALAIVGALLLAALVAGVIWSLRRRTSQDETLTVPEPESEMNQSSSEPIGGTVAPRDVNQLGWSDLSDADRLAFENAAKKLGLS